jgi:hypothetical protein
LGWFGLKKLNKTFWYAIQYEFLPYFCFSCGLLGHSEIRCPTPGERDANGVLPWGSFLRAPNDLRKKKGPPFAEGGYDDYDEWAANETWDNGKEEISSDGATEHRPPRANQFYARGRGRGFGGRGTKPSHVYRKLAITPMGTEAESVEPLNTDRDLVMFEPQLSGSKREEVDQKNSSKGAVTPDPKKKRVANNTSTSASAALQPRRDQ